MYGARSDAYEHFRSISGLKQDTLCLPRTLFAAKTSREFKKSGVLFIGVLLASKQMHAWIVEDGRICDQRDTRWVDYRPVAAIVDSELSK